MDIVAARGCMADVFISYARAERAEAEAMKARLEALGLSVFLDVEGLDGGDVFSEVLDREVKTSGVVLGLWSPLALSRPWVRIECDIGKRRGVLIPVAIKPFRDMEVPAPFWNVQFVDLTEAGDDPNNRNWLKLVKSLARSLKRPQLLAAESKADSHDGAAREDPRTELERMRRELAAIRGADTAAAPVTTGTAPARPRPPSQKPGGNAAIVAGGVAVLLLAAGGGLWFSGLLNGLFVPAPTHEPTHETAQAMQPPPPDANSGGGAITQPPTTVEAATPPAAAAPPPPAEPVYKLVQEREFSERLGPSSGTRSAVFSSDGTRLLVGYDNGVGISDTQTGKVLWKTGQNGFYNTEAAYSPDDRRIAALTGFSSIDHSVRILDAATGDEVMRLSGHSGPVTSVAYSPDGSRIATSSRDKTTRIWDTGTGKELLKLEGHTDTVTDLAFSGDGRRLATSSDDKSVRVWNVDTGRQELRIPASQNVDAIAFSPDGSRIAGGLGDGTGRVWDAKAGVQLAQLTGHDRSILSLAFSPDGSRIATGAWDWSARLWDAKTGKQLFMFDTHVSWVNSVAFSRDGSRLAITVLGENARILRVVKEQSQRL